MTEDLVPKNFMLRCHKCRWARRSSGTKADLADMHEIKNCPTCGKTRKFRCMKCGGNVYLKRISGNATPQTYDQKRKADEMNQQDSSGE